MNLWQIILQAFRRVEVTEYRFIGGVWHNQFHPIATPAPSVYLVRGLGPCQYRLRVAACGDQEYIVYLLDDYNQTSALELLARDPQPSPRRVTRKLP